MIAILDDGNIDVDDIALAQPLVAGNAVAYYVIHRGADGLREPLIVEGCRHSALHFDDVLMADPIQLRRSDPRPDMGLDHLQDLGGQTADRAHFLYLIGGLDRDAHGSLVGVAHRMTLAGGEALARCGRCCIIGGYFAESTVA